VWSRSGEHGRLGSLKAVNVLCVFGPSLFRLHLYEFGKIGLIIRTFLVKLFLLILNITCCTK
jgi:hypothetical protein